MGRQLILTAVQKRELSAIRNRIARLSACILRRSRLNTVDAVSIGGLVNRAKRILKHGHFERWLREECGYCPVHLRRFRRLYLWSLRHETKGLPLTEALVQAGIIIAPKGRTGRLAGISRTKGKILPAYRPGPDGPAIQEASIPGARHQVVLSSNWMSEILPLLDDGDRFVRLAREGLLIQLKETAKLPRRKAKHAVSRTA